MRERRQERERDMSSTEASPGTRQGLPHHIHPTPTPEKHLDEMREDSGSTPAGKWGTASPATNQLHVSCELLCSSDSGKRQEKEVRQV